MASALMMLSSGFAPGAAAAAAAADTGAGAGAGAATVLLYKCNVLCF